MVCINEKQTDKKNKEKNRSKYELGSMLQWVELLMISRCKPSIADEEFSVFQREWYGFNY